MYYRYESSPQINFSKLSKLNVGGFVFWCVCGVCVCVHIFFFLIFVVVVLWGFDIVQKKIKETNKRESFVEEEFQKITQC